jgi:peptidoglycan/LPS O-acetylase OafA/YrhL
VTLPAAPHPPRPESRVATVDCLRGLAASVVVWFHITNGNPQAYSPAWLRATGRQGYLGVEVFFVISGFVIPFALHRAHHHLAGYGRFLLRRIIRLDPPYFTSIALTMALAYASAALPGFRGQPPAYTLPLVLSHIAYANSFFGYTAINVVYWSLSLEFQYYLLMGLAFPLIAHNRQAVRLGTLVALGAVALTMPSFLLVFRWLFLFALGILAFYLRERMVNVAEYAAGVALAAAGTYVTLGEGAAVVGVATTLLIAFVTVRSGVLLFLGDISYSLYLIHVPIAGRVINAGTRVRLGPTTATLLAVTAFGVSVVAAFVFHRVVERPARAWAARIPYGDRREGLPARLGQPRQQPRPGDVVG